MRVYLYLAFLEFTFLLYTSSTKPKFFLFSYNRPPLRKTGFPVNVAVDCFKFLLICPSFRVLAFGGVVFFFSSCVWFYLRSFYLILYADYDVLYGIQCASARNGSMAKLCKNFGEVASPWFITEVLLRIYCIFFFLSRLVREFFK